jgi:hypothetical protein
MVRDPLAIRRQFTRLRQRWAWFDQTCGNITGLGRKEKVYQPISTIMREWS